MWAAAAIDPRLSTEHAEHWFPMSPPELESHESESPIAAAEWALLELAYVWLPVDTEPVFPVPFKMADPESAWQPCAQSPTNAWLSASDVWTCAAVCPTVPPVAAR